jgi:hypothetical protein
MELSFCNDGAERHHAMLGQSELDDILSAIGTPRPGKAGVRLHGVPGLTRYLAASGKVGAVAASILGEECHPVRAILFDKTPETNWSLGWHQDRTIAVRERVETDGFGPWTVKQGLVHVEPPFDLLAGMVTLRVHIDQVAATNAPLLIAPGSHKLGRIPVGEIAEIVHRLGTATCLADRGDIWLYATPILHSSETATQPSHRRVLQVDFAVGELRGELEWLGM